MQDKHTPGPWRIGWNYGAVVADHPVPEMDGSDHVAAYGGHMVGESIAPRNRALIAAAPELLEALKALFDDYKQLADSGDAGFWSLEETEVGKQAMAAIAKAAGSTS